MVHRSCFYVLLHPRFKTFSSLKRVWKRVWNHLFLHPIRRDRASRVSRSSTSVSKRNASHRRTKEFESQQSGDSSNPLRFRFLVKFVINIDDEKIVRTVEP